jgi:hypothetical protein
MTHNPQSPANTPPDNTPVSSTPDQRIDHVLGALRTAEPAAGIEARVLDRIHARLAEARVSEAAVSTAAAAPTTTPPTSAAPSIYTAILSAIKPSHVFSSPATRYAFAAASLAAVAAVSIFAAHSHHNVPAQTSASIVTSHIQTLASVEGAGLQSRRTHTTTSAALAAEAPRRGRPAAAAAAAVEPYLQPHHPPHVQNAALASTTSTPSTDPDTIALAETLAPSHPGPPMPLTEQERLLVAVARTGDKEEMTALNPVQREALFKQDQEAFEKFFAPPAPQKPILEAKNGATNDPHTETR